MMRGVEEELTDETETFMVGNMCGRLLTTGLAVEVLVLVSRFV